MHFFFFLIAAGFFVLGIREVQEEYKVAQGPPLFFPSLCVCASGSPVCTEEGHDFSRGVIVQLSTIDWFVYVLIIAAPLQIIASSSKCMSSVFYCWNPHCTPSPLIPPHGLILCSTCLQPLC